jgi:molybdate transport system substrate-binding protein
MLLAPAHKEQNRPAMRGESAMKRSRLGVAVGLALLLAAGEASAAELTVLCSNALKSVLEELGPQFEKASGHKLKIEYGSTGPLKTQIEKGQAFDVAILGVEATDDLIKRGVLAAGSRADIARSGMGVAIRKGVAKPDLATTAAFKAALLNAQTVAYSDGGLTGIYLKGLFDRLGMTEALKPKIRLGRGAEMVGEGKADIGLTQISEILPVAGAELAGPLPQEVQQYTVFPAAIGVGAAQPDAARALLKFLVSPDTAKVLKAKGLEPAA